jgi:hypothetical protein
MLSPRTWQPWPADLPLITEETEELDMAVVLYSCSFAVIFLMILSQARGCTSHG